MVETVIRKINNREGQAAVELAIVLPLLILILCGIVDFGWMFTNQNIIDHCAREGARYGIIHAADSGASTAIINYTKSLAPTNIASCLVITVTFTNPTSPRLGDVVVVVTGSIKALTPITGIFTSGKKMILKSSCTMKVE